MVLLVFSSVESVQCSTVEAMSSSSDGGCSPSTALEPFSVWLASHHGLIPLGRKKTVALADLGR